MNNFFNYEMLLTYATCVSAVFGTTQFIKDIPYIKKIPTRYLSFFVAFIIVVLTNIAVKKFNISDLLLYLLSSVFISMNSNGIYDFDIKPIKSKEDKNEEKN